jgi:hypothetical protein
MMDDALLRPGRLEVQIEIGLPKVHFSAQCCRALSFLCGPVPAKYFDFPPTGGPRILP